MLSLAGESTQIGRLLGGHGAALAGVCYDSLVLACLRLLLVERSLWGHITIAGSLLATHLHARRLFRTLQAFDLLESVRLLFVRSVTAAEHLDELSFCGVLHALLAAYFLDLVSLEVG